MKTIEMEYYLAKTFDWRKNVIVPRVGWGMGLHECDLLILSKLGYATEIEIKISKQDLKQDLKKEHKHIDVDWYGKNNDKIRFLYFAIPNKLENSINLIPENAGILIVNEGEEFNIYNRVKKLREAPKKSDYKFTEQERFNIARLGTMRIWNLKDKIIKLKEDINESETSRKSI